MLPYTMKKTKYAVIGKKAKIDNQPKFRILNMQNNKLNIIVRVMYSALFELFVFVVDEFCIF